MQLTASLLRNLRHDLPKVHFTKGEAFKWSPEAATISYHPDDPHGAERLLHEVAHAQLGHSSYGRDIELIGIERDAWQHARTQLAERYGVTIAIDTIEDDLDTYRDWLHARSTCPQCSANGLQTAKREYTCVACRHIWRVNQAISCRLRRDSRNPKT